MRKDAFYSLPLLIACDHAGFELKNKLLENNRFLWNDLGCFKAERTDYPDFANKLCLKLEKNMKGVLICGTGQGMSITANRWKHIRSSLCWNEEIAFLARSHNNSNVLCLPGQFLDEKKALSILKVFLKTPFENNEVYQRRIKKLS
ncbi:MAG: RpiB/LacA/LacB family sugar-phosphate isomerase [Bdellovibrionales bacterium]|nr:RpiB/LacA/LacB family sugar-phosphate isomerase [Bdellovibrionales bacterium]